MVNNRPVYLFKIYTIYFFSTFSRKRPHTHSPPLRSPEPLAKKVCSRATPPASPSRAAQNHSKSATNANNGINGHSNGSNGHSKTEPNLTSNEEKLDEQQDSPNSSNSRYDFT